MDLPIEVPLKRPVVVGDQTYDKLVFDEPDLNTQIAYAELEDSLPEPQKQEQGDGSVVLVRAIADEMKISRFWVAHLSGVPEAVAGGVKDSDLDAVNDAVSKVLAYLDTKGGDADGGASSGNESPAR